MMRLCAIMLLWLPTLSSPIHAVQHFKDSRLERAAYALGIIDSIRLDTLSYTYYIYYNGQQLKIRQGKGGNVEHIGIPLFSQAYASAYPSPVFDSLEFLTLCHLYHLLDNELSLSVIKFFHGSWDALGNIGEQKHVSVETVEEKYYLVKWQERNRTVVELTVPINYELLSCMSRKELYTDFVSRLKDPASINALPIDYFQAKQSHYIISEITQNQIIDSWGCLIYDKSLPQESMANLMLVSDSVAPNAAIQLELILDHDKREKLQIPLSRWNALCRSFGCIPYYGNEDSENGIVRGVQVMCNAPTGYNHVLYVECVKEDLGRKDISLKATAYLYVPSTNIKELFAAPKKRQSKTKRQKII